MVAFSDVLISWVQVYPVVNVGAYSILKGEIRSVKHARIAILATILDH